MQLNKQHFTYQQAAEFLRVIKDSVSDNDIVTQKFNGVTTEYLNIPCAFDIETSSFKVNEEKHACCYLWQFGFNGYVIIGRNLNSEFPALMYTISNMFHLDDNRKMICYIHNLGYEFQWIKTFFTWSNYEFAFMANTERKPFKATTVNGIEFRCSLILSGYNLAKVADNLRTFKLKKLKEQMDYSKIRGTTTKLDNDTIEYAVYDVLIVMAYVAEEIEQYGGDITKVPLTNTGRVRRYVKNACIYGKNGKRYRNFMRKLKLTPQSYIMAKKAFQGGFTHANGFYVGDTLRNVASYDLTSAYPAVMVSETFPVSAPEKIQIIDEYHFKYALKYKHCIFTITFFKIRSIANDCFISLSRCENPVNAQPDNGRLYYADSVTTTITELDFDTILKSYKFEHFEIGDFYVMDKGYLPIEFVNAILELYRKKTELKGVEGCEVEYLVSKGMLNSCYGMAVTEIVRSIFGYDNENNIWLVIEPKLEEKILEYNEVDGEFKTRFLYYLWGIYVTAWVRHEITDTIIKLGNDYVYSDTDSVKFLNLSRNQHIFDKFNQNVITKLKKVAAERQIDFEQFQPKTKKGVPKLIGVFDFEGEYEMFKTLGAKRYLTYKNGKLEITVAGVNKKTGVKALLPTEYRDYNEEQLESLVVTPKIAKQAFNLFDFELVFDESCCGKLVHDYIDYEVSGEVVDCTGNVIRYTTPSCVYLEPTTYVITVNVEFQMFVDALKGITVTEL